MVAPPPHATPTPRPARHPFSPHRRPRGRLFALLALSATLGAFLPTLAAPAAAAPTPQSADLQVWFEDFEGAFPGTNWFVNDSNPGNGSDYWGPSGNRRFAGAGSAWAASVGTQTVFWNATGNATRDPFNTSFESGMAIWNASDADPTEGDDYWGVSGFRYHNGTNSLWCAQVGYNNLTADNNSAVHLYDSYMDSTVWRTVDFSRVAQQNGTEVELIFWYFGATENGADFLDVVVDTGSGWTVIASYTGDSAGWQMANASLPTNTVRFGFRFLSDSGGILEGAYVDDIILRATHDEPNLGLRRYDIHMNATMWRSVDLAPYATALIEYRYWLNATPANDTLSVMYYVGGVWTFTDSRTNDSLGWQLGSVAIPTNATRVGFRFNTSMAAQREGAYLDNIRVVGHVNSIQCSATVSPSTGFEANTVFNYTVTAQQGLLPYGWSWNFNGSTNSTQTVLRTFATVGVYNASITVSDAAGQTCTTQAPPVTVTHDTTAVSVSPASASVTEGENITVQGLDRRGHPWPLNWSVTPSACGNLSGATNLANVTLRTGTSAGGLTCYLRGTFGPTGTPNATAVITVKHDLTTILITPATASVYEGSTLNFSATDSNSHSLSFIWSTSCGSAFPPQGPNTTFDAGNNGGTVCRVTAVLNGTVAIVNVTVLQDTSVIVVSPDFALIVEGDSVNLGALNRFNHIIDVNWSVSPAGCGELSVSHGNATRFDSSVDSGGLSCRVLGFVGAVSGSATVNVTHDTSALNLSIAKSSLIEGERTELSFLDVHGHPYSAAWRVDPSPCGLLSPLSGGVVNFTAGAEAAGVSCVITASVNAQAWRVNVSVSHGGPASIDVAPPAAVVVEGTGITLGASVRDASGHILSNRTPEWSSSCAALSEQQAVSTVATPPVTAGGQQCLVVASFANLTATITLSVSFAPPYTLTISPASASLGAGQTQTFTATVVDANGQVPDNVSIRWNSSCGGLSATAGPTVTVTAPTDLAGGVCTVTATTNSGGTPSSAQGTVSTGMSIVIPVLVALPAAAGVYLFLRWRKNRPPKFEQIGEGLMDDKKFEVEIR